MSPQPRLSAWSWSATPARPGDVRVTSAPHPPAHARPGPGVWQLDLADPSWDERAALDLLNREERGRALLGIPAVRRRRILLRAALRRVLGGLLDLSPERVPIEVHDGRPYLAGAPGHDRLEVSCSASAGLGLIAVAWGAPVGVDVQRHDDGEAGRSFGEGWLTPAEEAAVTRLAPQEQLTAVTRCWTQKEAVLKGLGVGLRRSPATVETPVAAGGRCGAWALSEVAVPPGYVASLAVRSASPVGPIPVVELTAVGRWAC